MRSYLVLAGLVMLAACGGDDSSAPQEPTYPAASGTYAVSGGFDGATPQEASFAGTVSVTQASRENPGLTGNFNVTATIGASVFVLAGSLQSATITTAGVISFLVGDSEASWSFSGTQSGTSFSGRHTLTDGVDAFSGSWSMQRTGNLTVVRDAARPSGATGELMRQLARTTLR